MPPLTMNSLLEIPWIIAIAIIIGVAAAAFIQLIDTTGRHHHRPVLLRLTIAGLLMVPFAIVVPEVMGIGYDTVQFTIDNQLPFWLLLGAGIAKLLITSVTLGLGMPSGVIGPTLFMGATLGGAMGLIGAQILPDMASSVGFYAMLGMGAMMGAVLQAPLAARFCSRRSSTCSSSRSRDSSAVEKRNPPCAIPVTYPSTAARMENVSNIKLRRSR